jgi:hypothetical protein
VKVLSQRGIPGFKIHRYRVVREGAFAVRERWNDSYPPTNQIVRVGSAEGVDADGVEDDPHPEYVADDYLVLLQGPDVKKGAPPVSPSAPDSREGGGMVESREAGKTGERGWTERAGFSHYVPRRRGDDAERCTGDCPTDGPAETARSKRAQAERDDRPVADRKRHREKRRERGRGS